MTGGRKKDVLIEDEILTNPNTGLSYPVRSVCVYADAKLNEIIKGVEGVTTVYNTHNETRYEVNIDPRYDLEHVKREIEAAILCKG